MHILAKAFTLTSVVLFSGCAMHLTEMNESIDGRDITQLWSNDLVGAKMKYCTNLSESDALVENFMKNVNKLDKYKVAMDHDKQAAERIKQKSKESLDKRFDTNFSYDEDDLFISNWIISLDKYSPALGGHPLQSFNNRKLVVEKKAPEDSLRKYGKVDPKLFIDDFQLETTGWASIYGINPLTINGFDAAGNRVYRPKTAFLRGQMNVIVDIPIDTKKPIGLHFNETIDKYVLKVSKDQSRALISQAIERGKDPQVYLSMAYEINDCIQDKNSNKNLLVGKVVESKVFTLEYSNLAREVKGDGWVAGEMISHWYEQ